MLVERPVVFENEGQQLVGIVHEPEGGVRGPGIIFLHGFTGNRYEPHRLFVKTARVLAHLGFWCLRFDFRGSGDSQGDFKDMTVSGEISDALTALRWFKENTQVNPEKIGVLGLSLGACVATYLVAQSVVQTLVLWSGLAKPVESFTQEVPYDVMKNQARKQGGLDFKGWRIGIAFLEELASLNPLEVIQQYNGSVLIVHGNGDTVIPVEQGKLYYEKLNVEDKELYIVEDADHTFNKIDWEQEVIRKTVAWLEKRLK